MFLACQQDMDTISLWSGIVECVGRPMLILNMALLSLVCTIRSDLVIP